jgi:hypothetical protein
VRVHVADAGGKTADVTSYVVVYENVSPSGASFVIGDRAAGPLVYFWGTGWGARNPMSGGAAPPSFKGFANGSATSCGKTFTEVTGNSGAPPARVPAYMAVAVAGSVTKSGSQFRGTVEKIVVIKTDPGYRPNAGSAGTGHVVATVCG